MIKEIFLPEKTKTRRLISKRIIGIALHEDHVSASQVYATSSTTTIENLLIEPIQAGAPDRIIDRTGTAITKVLQKLSKYDQIRISIPSSIVTFKELTLPFIDLEKIKMVIEYEVEPQLPFSIHDAIIDFVVTSQNIEEKKSHVLIAAVQKKDFLEIVDMYEHIEIDPDAVTIDLFATYGLYLQIPEYKNIKNGSAIVDIGKHSTSVAFIMNGQLRLIRNIGKGIDTIVDHICKDNNRPKEEILDQLEKYGMQKADDPLFNQSAQKHVTHFLNDIQFTLNSFSLKLNFYDEISKILITGENKIQGQGY